MPRYRHDDLHLPDGTHRSTPPTTSGHDLAVYERSIRRHLDRHAKEPTMPRRFCPHSGVTPARDDAILPDGTVVPDGLLWEPDCDDDGCHISLVMDVELVDAIEDWAEHRAAQPALLEHLRRRNEAYEPHEYLIFREV